MRGNYVARDEVNPAHHDEGTRQGMPSGPRLHLTVDCPKTGHSDIHAFHIERSSLAMFKSQAYISPSTLRVQKVMFYMIYLWELPATCAAPWLASMASERYYPSPLQGRTSKCKDYKYALAMHCMK